MRFVRTSLSVACLVCLYAAVLGSCGSLGCQSASAPAAKAATTSAAPTPSAEEQALAEKQKQIDAEYPLHGLITGLQLKVHKEADAQSIVLGFLRVGSRVRLAREVVKAPTCATGFYRVARMGWACAGEGIQIGETPPESPLAIVPPARDAALPYSYYYVKEEKAAEYHRLPSRDEQRIAETFSARYLELKAKDPKKAQAFIAGELPNEPHKMEIVRRYVDRGFFVASSGIEIRAFRKFARTATRGSYMKLIDLEPRTATQFHGVVLDEQHKLPIAWAVREAQSFIPRAQPDGTIKYLTDPGVKTFARLSILPWVKRERVGDQIFHKLDDAHYLKAWYVAIAQTIARPKEIGKDEPWVHVNIDQQTLVMYRGDTPIYATLISSGLEGHDTPMGLFTIRSKHVSTSMSDIGPDVSEDLRYSIEDVPWTQYFSGSLALHGAFWHAGFGLRHSHGCVNLAPLDAHYIFDHTWPELDDGWHGVTTDQTGLKGSHVLITPSDTIPPPPPKTPPAPVVSAP